MQFSTEIPQSGTPQIHMFSGRICAERGPRSQREQSRPTGLITDGAGRGETAINADLQPAVAALKPVLMPGMGIEVMEVGIGHAFGGNAADHIDHANYLTASIHLEFGEVVGILVPHHDTESCAQWGDGSFGPDVNHLGCGRFARHSDEYTGFVGNKRVTVHIGFGVGRALVLGALNRAGIEIVTHIGRCAGISDAPFALDDPAALAAQAEALLNKFEGFALLDGSVEEPMKAAIRAAGSEGDSVGGVLETAILGLPAGVGEPYFDSVESKLAHLAFSIPAVKGIEFGSGFGFADQKGSEANDAFRRQGERIVTATNHNAGLNGGISNGMPVVFRTAVKPTPSIYKTQDTVDYIAKKDAELSIQGRHDPCIVPRAAIVQTCAAALAVGDLLTAKYGMAWMEDPTGYRKEVL